MKEIQLTQGKVALVDDADYDYLMQWKWRAAKGASTWYAVRMYTTEGKATSVYMHRLLLVFGASEKLQVDHENGDGLDNQRHNLRPATKGQNMANQKPRSSSGYKGVYPRLQKWVATINFNGRMQYLGYYRRAIDAAVAYDEAAQIYHGEFARLNFSYDPACFI